MRNRVVTMLGIVPLLVFGADVASAMPATLTYQHGHHSFSLNPSRYPEWRSDEEYWTVNGREVTPLAEWRVDGDTIPALPEGVERHVRQDWNRSAIGRVIRDVIADTFDRDAGKVVISMSGSGNVTFDGIGMLGRKVNVPQAVTLTIDAIESDISSIMLPVEEIQPDISVTDPILIERGIKEVIAVGESNFAGSPANRRHNIATGLEKFNGHIVPQGEVFSFNEVLGPVNARTGYKPELVILGDKTLPEYGGGLCQVSTTAYRGVWEYGLPIEERRNHSFAVQYYSPQGTDATIYPPHTDMKFRNDTPGDILLQTHVDEDNAYYIYYGTDDDRESEVYGPFTWGHVGIPPTRNEYVTGLPPGTMRKVGSPVPGLKAAWFRVLGSDEPEIEGFYSIYQARPLYYQIGVSPDTGKTDAIEEPTWMLTPDTEVEPSAPDRQPSESPNYRPTRRGIRNGR